MSASPNLQLPYLDANQNQKSVTHNAALRRLDALVQVGVLSSALEAPPAAPADGQRWIVAPGGTGAWAGKDLNIAAWQDGAWSFYAPGPGTLAFDAAQAALVYWTGTAWSGIAGLLARLGVTALGIGTAPDAGNPLSATLNAALFNALGTGAGGSGDVRVKLNKAAPGNTASLLFQDGFSGRAEIGLAGDDSFHVKVSPDGASFSDALVLAAGGAATFLVPPSHPTPPPGDASTKSATTGFVAAGYAGLDPLAISPVHPTLDYRLTAPDCLPTGQFSRLSAGYRTNAAGLLVPVAAGTLRIDHDPVTGMPLGALIEEQRTNLLLFSQAFDAAAWSASALSVSADSVAAPDGTLTADRLTSTGADGFSAQAVTLPAGPFTISLWCKSPDAGRVANIVVQAGSTRLVSAKPALSATWQRVAASGTNPTSQSVSVCLGGDGTLPSGAIVDRWGAQIETGAVPTSYIPTTSAQATRTADSVVVPLDATIVNPAEGTFFLEGLCSANDVTRTFFEASGGATADTRMMLRNDLGSYKAWCSVNGNAYAGLPLGPTAPGGRLRAAMSYTATSLTGSVNGSVTASVAITGALPTLQTLRVGSSLYDSPVDAQISRLAYLPRALTPAQLQAMTS